MGACNNYLDFQFNNTNYCINRLSPKQSVKGISIYYWNLGFDYLWIYPVGIQET